MHRFFVNPEAIQGGKAVITGEDVIHIGKALRLNTGDEIIVCDGNGKEFRAEILDINRQRVEVILMEEIFRSTEPKCKVTLYQGLPKSDKMDWIVQKTVELGISQIVPLLTKRSVVRIDSEKGKEKKQARWMKIAEEAAKQCGRTIIPAVEAPQSLNEALSNMKRHQLLLVPWEEAKDAPIKTVLKGVQGLTDIGICIGPEGGFPESEVQDMVAAGGKVVTLGSRILRTETAGMAVLTMVLYHMDEYGG